VEHKIRSFRVCNLPHIIHFLPIILQWFIGFLEPCAPLRKKSLSALGLNSRETPLEQLTADGHVTAILSGESKVTGAKYIQDKLKQIIYEIQK